MYGMIALFPDACANCNTEISFWGNVAGRRYCTKSCQVASRNRLVSSVRSAEVQIAFVMSRLFAPFCFCGCGEQCTSSETMFVTGHWLRWYTKNVKPLNLGKKRTPEQRYQLSVAHKGQHSSPTTEFKEGQIRRWTPDQRRKISLRMVGNRNGSGRKGIKISEETRKKLSISYTGLKYPQRKRKSTSRSYSYSHTRPSKPEKRVISIKDNYSLPYDYVGDGKLWIGPIAARYHRGQRNPDFIHRTEKVVVEVADKGDKEFRKKIPWAQWELKTVNFYSYYGWKCIVLWTDMYNEEIVRALGGKQGTEEICKKGGLTSA